MIARIVKLLFFPAAVTAFFGRKQKYSLIQQTVANWYEPDAYFSPTSSSSQLALQRIYVLTALNYMSAMLNIAMPESVFRDPKSNNDVFVPRYEVTGEEMIEVEGFGTGFTSFRLASLINVSFLKEIKNNWNSRSFFERNRLTKLRMVRDMDIQGLYSLIMGKLNWNLSALSKVPMSRWSYGYSMEVVSGSSMTGIGNQRIFNPDAGYPFAGFQMYSSNPEMGKGVADIISALNAVVGDAPFNLSMIRQYAQKNMVKTVVDMRKPGHKDMFTAVMKTAVDRTYSKVFVNVERRLDLMAFSRLCLEYVTEVSPDEGMRRIKNPVGGVGQIFDDETPKENKAIELAVTRRFNPTYTIHQSAELEKRVSAVNLQKAVRGVIARETQAGKMIASTPDDEYDERPHSVLVAEEMAINKGVMDFVSQAGGVVKRVSKKTAGSAAQVARGAQQSIERLENAAVQVQCATRGDRTSAVCLKARNVNAANKSALLIAEQPTLWIGNNDEELSEAISSQDVALEEVRRALEMLEGSVGPAVMYDADRAEKEAREHICVIVICVCSLIVLLVSVCVLYKRRRSQVSKVAKPITIINKTYGSTDGYEKCNPSVLKTSDDIVNEKLRDMEEGSVVNEKLRDMEEGSVVDFVCREDVNHDNQIYDFYTGDHCKE